MKRKEVERLLLEQDRLWSKGLAACMTTADPALAIPSVTKQILRNRAEILAHFDDPPVDPKQVTITLNPYQAANLLWLLKLAWYGQLAITFGGDWVGEIPQQLEKEMKDAGGEFVTYRTNNGKDPINNPQYKDGKYVWPE